MQSSAALHLKFICTQLCARVKKCTCVTSSQSKIEENHGTTFNFQASVENKRVAEFAGTPVLRVASGMRTENMRPCDES